MPPIPIQSHEVDLNFHFHICNPFLLLLKTCLLSSLKYLLIQPISIPTAMPTHPGTLCRPCLVLTPPTELPHRVDTASSSSASWNSTTTLTDALDLICPLMLPPVNPSSWTISSPFMVSYNTHWAAILLWRTLSEIETVHPAGKLLRLEVNNSK